MSAHVTNILDGGITTIAATLGSDWKRLMDVYDVRKNVDRVARKGYGMRPLDGATPDSQVNRYYTMDQRFEVVLTDVISRGDTDAELNASIGNLYDKSDEIFKAMIATKVGYPSAVLNCFSPSVSAPEILGEGVVILRLQFTVKYRSALN